jgi:hypothetical protein
MEAKNIIKLSVFFALFISLAPVSIMAAAPDAIVDLRCFYSGTPGGIFLSWTAPSGSPTGYEVRYSVSGLNESNYNYSTVYAQAWASSAVKGYVGNLDQSQYLFFAMKAINGDGSSAISNIVWCKANGGEPLVQSAPSSSISNLQNDSQIPENKNYMINGSSTDAAGLSIQRVEISMDDGKTWTGTALKQTASGSDWEYNWILPKAGEYLLKTRATGQTDVMEDPKAAIKVKVVPPAVQGQSSTTTIAAATSTISATSTASTTIQSEDQQRRSLLIQIIMILLQLLGRR